MTKETKPAVKKTVTKKVSPKKHEAVETPIVEQPVRAKRVQIEANELIPCRSTTHGELIYISKRTGERITWNDYDNVQEITMGELKNLYASHPNFINNVRFVIDDATAVESMGLTRLYDTIFDIGDLNSFFNKDYQELEELLPKLPKGLKDTVGTKARELMKNGKLDSRAKIKLVEEKLQIELLLLED